MRRKCCCRKTGILYNNGDLGHLLLGEHVSENIMWTLRTGTVISQKGLCYINNEEFRHFNLVVQNSFSLRQASLYCIKPNYFYFYPI